MRSQILILAAALALAAGCNKSPDQGKPAAGTDKAPPQSPVNTPSTPANASGGASASREEQKEGANPVQGQVDPKDSVQQRDFQQRGDGAGPKGPDTEPKQGK
jgi:hypothetical protein